MKYEPHFNTRDQFEMSVAREELKSARRTIKRINDRVRMRVLRQGEAK